MLHNRFRITFSAACFTCCLAAFLRLRRCECVRAHGCSVTGAGACAHARTDGIHHAGRRGGA